MSKVSCEIIKDLLPLYFDDICSDDSKRFVENNLVDCEECKLELEKIQLNFKLPSETIENSRNVQMYQMVQNVSVCRGR